MADLNKQQNHDRAISQAFERWKAPGGEAFTPEERVEICGNARAQVYRQSIAKGKGIPPEHEVQAAIRTALASQIEAKLEESQS